LDSLPTPAVRDVPARRASFAQAAHSTVSKCDLVVLDLEVV
jgi:hypothetical protein